MERSENVEEYLEALWIIREDGSDVARINQVSEHLRIAPPSAVEMLRKMEEMKLVRYLPREGVSLTTQGAEEARQVIRNHRLAELLLTEILDIKVDEEAACGLEHHMGTKLANAVCEKLDHPGKCPHGKKIPRGECCPQD
jgi:DtxR family Mn-dependent transcriptional regulator